LIGFDFNLRFAFRTAQNFQKFGTDRHKYLLQKIY
jgi:hypothetical protein